MTDEHGDTVGQLEAEFIEVAPGMNGDCGNVKVAIFAQELSGVTKITLGQDKQRCDPGFEGCDETSINQTDPRWRIG